MDSYSTLKRFGLVGLVCLLGWLGAATSSLAKKPASTKGLVPRPACVAFVRKCRKTCIKKLKAQVQGTFGNMPTDSARTICLSQCLKQARQLPACLPKKAPPPVRLPSPKEIAKLSPFCRKFLGICVRSCVRSNSRLKDKNGREYPLKVLQIFCRRRCWGLPARKRLCKMKRSQLLASADKLLKQLEGEVKVAEEEDKKEEQRYLRQQAEINRQRAAAQAKAQKEAQKQLKEEQERRKEAARLKAQKKALAKERARIQRMQAQLKKQAAQKAKAKLQELQEERKRLALQKKQLQEQQQRLKIQKQQIKERRQEAKKKQKLEAARKREQDKLLQQQRSELSALKKQRLKYQQELARVRELAKKEQQMAQQAKTLAQKRKQAKKNKNIQRQLRKLKDKSKQIKKQKQAIQKNRDRFKKRRQRRRRRLAMLRRRMRRASRRRLRKTHKQRAQKAFRQGQWTQADRYFKRAKRNDLASKIPVFREVLNRGRNAYDQRNADIAIPELERAFTLDLELGGRGSKHGKLLRKMLADMYYLKGRLSLSRKYYSSAYIYLSAAQRYVFDHPAVVRGIARLRTVANNYYQQALSYDAGSQYRRKLLRKAIRLVGKSDPLYKKLQSILDK